MKKIKISIIVIVVVAICAAISYWVESSEIVPNVKPPENPFTIKIEKEIADLKTKPNNQFCKEFYRQIAYNINQFYTQNRFDSIPSQNTAWKEILEKNLYAAYTEKFIIQAKTVFRGAEWKPNDIRFIQSEKNELKKSPLLLAGSPVDNELSSIQKVLDKYNEVVSFISACKGFSYSEFERDSLFPVEDVKSKISRAVSLRKNHLENGYVDNCIRLHDDLKEIPQTFFEAHIAYLDNKINDWSDMYPNYISHSDYSYNLYKPLKTQIESLDKNMYNVSNFDVEYDRLLKKWRDDNVKAYNHKYK